MKKIFLVSFFLIGSMSFLFYRCSSEKSKEESMVDETIRLNQFLDSVYNAIMLDRNPVRMGTLGIDKKQDQWTNLSEEYCKEEMELLENQLQIMKSRFQLQELNFSADRTEKNPC